MVQDSFTYDGSLIGIRSFDCHCRRRAHYDLYWLFRHYGLYFMNGNLPTPNNSRVLLCFRQQRGRFQSAAGGVPVWASIDSCSACEAGVFSGRRQMCPNNEWRLSAIRDGTSGSFVLSLTTALDTLSYHLIPRIRRSACMWKDWILSLSTLRIVHVSKPYNTTDCTREVYLLSLVQRLSLCW